jgi:acetyl-CoA C-acetyltransferase
VARGSLTPVLAGVGSIEQRCEDPADALEARELMLRALLSAGADAGSDKLLEAIDVIALPHGQWHYGDPGRWLAAQVGASGATTVVSLIGVLQQTLIADACERIARGDAEVVVVVGGEARYRNLRARILEEDPAESADDGTPDAVLRPTADLVLESEVRGGLGPMPVGYYAVIESALRASLGRSVAEHRDAVAALYARFSEVAAENPHAWKREVLPAAFIRDASAKNPMLAFPYTKLHNSSWNVDQATALLFCSADVARGAGVDPARLIHPLASAESNHALPLSARPDLAACPGVRIAGQRAFAAAGVDVDAVDAVDLYSCFPAAVQLHARELGIGADRDWTVTGGMPFAGGPFNSYVLQSTGRIAEILRERRGVGVVTTVSGLLTKHAVALWSSEPGANFSSQDVSGEVAEAEPARPVVAEATGPGTVCGSTVVGGGDDRIGVALVDLATGERFLARSDDAAVIAELETVECVGRSVAVGDGQFRLR